MCSVCGPRLKDQELVSEKQSPCHTLYLKRLYMLTLEFFQRIIYSVLTEQKDTIACHFAARQFDWLHIFTSSVHSKCCACCGQQEGWQRECPGPGSMLLRGIPQWCFQKQDLLISQQEREARLCSQANETPSHKPETTRRKQCIKMWWCLLFACILICTCHSSGFLKTLKMEYN